MKELELIKLYYYLCECYNTELRWYCQRFSPNSSPSNEKITDEELLCIYFYCRVHENKQSKKGIHDFANRFMKSWFPNLPNYANFNTRLNMLHSSILGLLPILLQHIDNEGVVKNIEEDILLIDAFPIMLCSGKRKGKVATEISDKTYCATKGVFYYGVKMHTLAKKVTKKLPLIDFISITKASENDLTAFRPILNKLINKSIFADKAYCDIPLNQQLMKEQNSYIYTPVKLVKGDTVETRQFKKAADDLFSTAVSTVRQPIESLFNWINELTNLQDASKIRATGALYVHIFGAIAVALFKILNF
jgi:Transposase DDE domain